MANPKKNKRIYQSLVEKLYGLSRGDSKKDIGNIVNRNFMNFLGGFRVSEDNIPANDFPSEVIRNLQEYADLCGKRKKVVIAGGERTIATETEALRALKLSYDLLGSLVIPFFSNPNPFTDRLFNEMHDLSFSYVDAIVSAVADEYINVEDVYDKKFDSTELAKQGSKICEAYKKGKLDRNTLHLLAGFQSRLIHADKKAMRPDHNVAITRKKVYEKENLTRRIASELMGEKAEGRPDYIPNMIVPIAHGGTELGVDIANAYEKEGIPSSVYPLMYSIKTRKQKHPWVHDDSDFFKDEVSGKDLLVTEDWVTTGNTLRGILIELEKYFPKEVKVATIKRDREKSHVPFLDNYDMYIGKWALYTGDKTDSLEDMQK